jgi:hypothetical protein
MGISKVKFYRRNRHLLSGGSSSRTMLSFARKVHHLTHRTGTNVDIEPSGLAIKPPDANPLIHTRLSDPDVDFSTYIRPPDINPSTCNINPSTCNINPSTCDIDSSTCDKLPDPEKRHDADENLSEILNVCMHINSVFLIWCLIFLNYRLHQATIQAIRIMRVIRTTRVIWIMRIIWAI